MYREGSTGEGNVAASVPNEIGILFFAAYWVSLGLLVHIWASFGLSVNIGIITPFLNIALWGLNEDLKFLHRAWHKGIFNTSRFLFLPGRLVWLATVHWCGCVYMSVCVSVWVSVSVLVCFCVCLSVAVCFHPHVCYWICGGVGRHVNESVCFCVCVLEW